jgi:hypothetical protein
MPAKMRQPEYVTALNVLLTCDLTGDSPASDLTLLLNSIPMAVSYICRALGGAPFLATFWRAGISMQRNAPEPALATVTNICRIFHGQSYKRFQQQRTGITTGQIEGQYFMRRKMSLIGSLEAGDISQ